MTFEGRKFTHENCLRLGKPSPYAEEFKEVVEIPKTDKKVAVKGLKSKSKEEDKE